MLPPAPLRLSTITCCFHASVNFCATMRGRVFDIDIEHCACRGKLKFVAMIERVV